MIGSQINSASRVLRFKKNWRGKSFYKSGLQNDNYAFYQIVFPLSTIIPGTVPICALILYSRFSNKIHEIFLFLFKTTEFTIWCYFYWLNNCFVIDGFCSLKLRILSLSFNMLISSNLICSNLEEPDYPCILPE